MPYQNKRILTEKLGNNVFAWEKRTENCGHSPILNIPQCIKGNISDIQIGDTIVFEEMEDGTLKSCKGLNHFVEISPNIAVFDNHNHALYFWIEAVRIGLVKSGFELIHIDEHSDLWNNDNELDLKRAVENPEYTWEFTNLSCNVGNYMLPAIESGLITNVVRIENEYQIDTYMEYNPGENSVLNLDLDIFAPELDHIPENKKIQIIRNLFQRVKYVTIATSPYFIDQGKALEILKKILKKHE